jgi:hypothetical protein
MSTCKPDEKTIELFSIKKTNSREFLPLPNNKDYYQAKLAKTDGFLFSNATLTGAGDVGKDYSNLLRFAVSSSRCDKNGGHNLLGTAYLQFTLKCINYNL